MSYQALGPILLGSFGALLLLRVPVAVALGTSAVLVIYLGQLGVGVISYNFQAAIAKFPLLAIPFFILAGVVMDRAGIAERIVGFALATVGRLPAGAAVAGVAVAMFWGAVSGSGPATVAALAPILVPMMVRRGYGKPFAAALISASAELSIIIPPSIAFILYATIVSGSVAEQFLAGVLPGILMGLLLMAAALWIVRRRGWDRQPSGGRAGASAQTGENGPAEGAAGHHPGFGPESRLPPLLEGSMNPWRRLREASWGLLTPVIILGGVYGGVFTPTEAAVVAVAWGLLVGFFVYRTLRLSDLTPMLHEAAVSSAVVMGIVAWAGLFAWAADTIGLVGRISQAALAAAGRPYLFLGLLNVAFLFLGTLMDAVSIYYVTLPVLIPVIAHLGWDPVWFGVMMTVNLAIGQVTPPVAVNLFVASRVNRISIEALWGEAWRLVVAGLIGLILVTYLPGLSLSLPRLLYAR